MKRFQQVKKSLGKAYCMDDNFLLYNCDCMEAMSKLPPETFNLVVTSPPYNIGKEYEERMSKQEYLDWTRDWVSLVKKLLRPDGTFWFNIGFYKASKGKQYIPWEYHIYPLIQEISDLQLVQQIIWHYGAGVNCKLRFSPRKETWLFLVRDLDNYTFNLDDIRVPHKYPNQKKNGKIKVNPNGKNPGDVWKIKKVTSGKNRASPERTDHPAQFPREVIDRIIQVSSNKGDLVLDPFIGSGTVAVSALKFGRLSVGFEVEQDYCDIAVKRYERNKEKLKQQELFRENLQ